MFSAVVTAFIIESYKLLSPDSGDQTVTLLTTITNEIASSSGNKQISPPPPEQTEPQNNHAIALNVLFFLSLIGSIACALGATLVQGWTSRYIRITTKSGDLVERARDRAWYFDGLEKSRMEFFASAVHTVLHMSLFLFLVGIIVFLEPISPRVADAAIVATVIVAVLYLTFALIHVFMENTPYSTPFSTLLVNTIYGSIIAVVAAIFLGISLFVAGIVLGIVLLICVLAIPFLPFNYQSWKESLLDMSQSQPATLARSKSIAAYKGTQQTQVVSRMLGTRSNPVRDRKALKWLLSQVVTVADLEELVDGIQLFVEKTAEGEKETYANIILELGGRNVGAFGAGLGHCVGHLLETCTHVGSVELEADHRRVRALSASRAMVSIFCYCTSTKRTEDITISDTAPDVMREIFYDYDNDRALPCTRWADWLDVFIWTPILGLREDPDPTIKQHISYLTTLLSFCALSDVATRMHTRDLEIFAPAWDIRTLLAALKQGGEAERAELYELAVAFLLVPNLEEPTEPVTGVYDLPEHIKLDKKKQKKPGRAIKVVLNSASSAVNYETFRNEAMLLALTTLIDQIPTGTSIDHSDTLSRIIPTIINNTRDGDGKPTSGTAKGTSAASQRAFVAAVDRHRVAALATRAGSAPTVTVTAPRDDGITGPSRKTVHSVFHIPSAIDDIVKILESVDDADSLTTVGTITSFIRATQPKVQVMFQKQIQQRASMATDRASRGGGMTRSTSRLPGAESVPHLPSTSAHQSSSHLAITTTSK